MPQDRLEEQTVSTWMTRRFGRCAGKVKSRGGTPRLDYGLWTASSRPIDKASEKNERRFPKPQVGGSIPAGGSDGIGVFVEKALVSNGLRSPLIPKVSSHSEAILCPTVAPRIRAGVRMRPVYF